MENMNSLIGMIFLLLIFGFMAYLAKDIQTDQEILDEINKKYKKKTGGGELW